MGYKLIMPDNSDVDIDELLEKYVLLYAKSEEEFYREFDKLSAEIFEELEYLSCTDEYEGTQYEDTADLAVEVIGYYNSYKKRTKKQKVDKSNIFTLRNADDLVVFEVFLDKMLKLKDLSEKHFIILFPKCPAIFWDKIDDLRETSFKLDRDSEEYTRCLQKCKTLSFDFSELSGTNTSNYE